MTHRCNDRPITRLRDGSIVASSLGRGTVPFSLHENRDSPRLVREPSPSTGFTLLELLVVTAILSLLAASVTFAVAGSREKARKTRTRAQITRLHALTAPLWEEYQTRRVPIRLAPTVRPDAAAEYRLMALRDLMRMEMPDRMSDIVFVDRLYNIEEDDTNNTGSPPIPENKDRELKRPALMRSYRQALVRARIHLDAKHGGDKAKVIENLQANQGAECLYMIIASISDGNSTGLSFFSETEIGDVDDDRLPEILDGWGTPIMLLRWGPSFRSPLQTGPDPFDPTSDGETSIALYPIIMSAGPDKKWDVQLRPDPKDPRSFNYTDVECDPFATGADLIGGYYDYDEDGDDNSFDNIHNHMLEVN